MCRAHATVRGVLGGLLQGTERIAIVDLEAGLEHLSRGTARHVDTLLIVAEPYFKSLETASRSFTLARELGIEGLRLVANKIRTPRDEQAVREFAGRHGMPLAAVVPWDDAVAEADRHGAALLDYRPDSRAVEAIGRIGEVLLPVQ
jgi:CO dehydrogenase maturation factor